MKKQIKALIKEINTNIVDGIIDMPIDELQFLLFKKDALHKAYHELVSDEIEQEQIKSMKKKAKEIEEIKETK